MLSNTKFAKWCISMIGQGYLMGAVGQETKDISPSSYLITQYSGSQLTKAKYWLTHVKRVFDCQGMSDCYVTENTGVKTNVYARNNYANWCGIKGEGSVPKEYRMPGVAVFIHSKSAGHITHVGYLVEPVTLGRPESDWWVVEARGVMYGVVKTKLSERGWNRWGLMTKYFDYDGYSVEPMQLGDRVLSKGMVGEDVKDLQMDLISLGFSCGSYGADGDFGSATEAAVKQFQKANGLVVDGIAGINTISALLRLIKEDPDPQETNTAFEVPIPAPVKKVTIDADSVWIWDGHPSYNGEKNVILHRGDELLVPALESYIPVVHNGVIKWINKRYVGGLE